jgi:site-specific DNA recombinase
VIAAIYARKSTEQKQADAEAKSVSRQIENAKVFARAKGWTVLDDFVFSDDNVKGAEVKKQIGRQRLLDIIHKRHHTRPELPFQALIIRDESRFSRRDGDESFGELKQIVRAGVQVWFYQTGQPFAFGDFSSNIIGMVKAETAAEYRRQCGRLVNEALTRKFKDGYVTGGRVFGYDNIKVDGHTERRINQAEAAVVRRIFTMSAAGDGFTRIALQLNADKAPAPKPQQGRQAGWIPRTVGLAVKRSLYRGEAVYGRQQSKGPDGTRIDALRAKEDVLTAYQPELRIVSDQLWTAAHTRLAATRQHFAGETPGRHRRHDSESKYLLSGFARCATCGGAMGVVRGFYGCLRYHARGKAAGTNGCQNGHKIHVATMDTAVQAELKKLLQPATILVAVEKARASLSASTVAKDLKQHRQDLQAVNRQADNLAKAIATGGQLEPLLVALKARQIEQEMLQAKVRALESVDVNSTGRHVTRKELQQRLDRWHRMLDRVVDDSRRALRRLLDGPLVMTPAGKTADGRRQYRFSGEVLLNQVLAGDVDGLPTNGPNTSAQSKAWIVKFQGIAA